MRRLLHPAAWRFFIGPLFLTVASLFASFATSVFPGWLCSFSGLLFFTGIVYFLVSAIVWFVKHHWRFGLAAAVCLAVSVLSLAPAFVFAIVQAENDHFADNLTLPKGIELSDPAKSPGPFQVENPAENDSFQRALKESLTMSDTGDTAIEASIPALAILHREHPKALRQYLAAHPAWWVHVHRGKEFATRRWRIQGQWRTRLHGYFSNFSPSTGNRFQTRTCLGLSGQPWHRNAQEIPVGANTVIPLSEGNNLHESYVFWREGGITVEVFEQGESRERRMTKAAIRELRKEFATLLHDPTWEHAKSLLPQDAIHRGQAGFILSNGMQGGIYVADIRCNPGEPGRLHLKAFEITKNTPLSAKALEERSNEFIGWSANPDEQFPSTVEFTIYEGNWGQYYGARFEVWFTPENGDPDRKLLESNWKIEGWMR